MSKKPTTAGRTRTAQPFDEVGYRDALMRAGMSEEDAAGLARRTAEARKASAEVAAPASDVLGLPSPADEAAFEAGGAPARKLARTAKEKPIRAVFDYRNGKIPERVRDLIEAHLAIEREDAKSAGTLSAAGEPLQRLPPSEQRPCTWVEPIRLAASTRPGQSLESAGCSLISAPVTAAPIR